MNRFVFIKAFTEMVDQLVELSLPSPEVRGLNPIRNIIEHFSTNCNLENLAVTAHLLKQSLYRLRKEAHHISVHHKS